jgi:predicted nucleotidyltransferase
MIQKATPFKFSPDCSLITCSAEDLIVLKAFADRPKDWNDVETIAMRQENNLNIEYITEQLTPLCDLKESPEIIVKLKKLLQN